MIWDDEYTNEGTGSRMNPSDSTGSDMQGSADYVSGEAAPQEAAAQEAAPQGTAQAAAQNVSAQEAAAQETAAQEAAAQSVSAQEAAAQEAAAQEQETSDTTYRYTSIPHSREEFNPSGGSYSSAGGAASGSSYSSAGSTASGSSYSSAGGAASGSSYSSAGTAASGSGDETVYQGDVVEPDRAEGGKSKHGGNSTYSEAGTGAQYAKPKKKTKKKKKKKKSTGGRILGFIGKCVAAALIFGVVASLTFNGVNSLLGGSDSSGSTSTTGALVSSASGDASTSTTVTVGTATALDVSDVVENVMPSIVSVTSIYTTSTGYGFGDSSYSYSSVGSGIIVATTDETLYIVTNNHVVEDADSVSVTFVDDAEVSAEIKGTDSSNDLAVLSVTISDMSADTAAAISVATLGDSDAIEVGETTIAIGNALGYGQSVTTGIVSALNREVTIDNVTSLLIQTDAAINPGNSGGALLNAAGEVIGINSAKYSDTDVEGMGYAIPINTAIPIINDLIEKEKVDESQASYLGIAGVDVSEDVSSQYNMPTGVYIAQVMSGSAAETAGIQEGDILTTFDGKTISSMEELQSLMEYYAGGTTIEVVVERANNGTYEEITLTVTLGYKNE